MQRQTSSTIRSRQRGRRRGSIYIVVLFTSLIVSVLGMSAIMISRIQRRTSQGVADATEARLYAQAALRVGLMRIEEDANWRYAYPSGVWESDVAVGDGTYTLSGIDPSDNDLDDAPEDPLILIGTGKKGSATHKTQITLSPVNRGYSCLETALHSDNDVKIFSATLNCDQTVSANHDVDASSSAVNCDAQAVNDVKGSNYNGDTDSGVPERLLPDTTDVLDFYLDNGTWIDKDCLDFGYGNALKNPGFEAGTSDWEAVSCTVLEDNTEFYSGAASLKVTDRNRYWDSPKQDVTSLLQNGVTYDVQARVKMMSASDVSTRFRLKLYSTGSGWQNFYSGWTDVKQEDGWKLAAKTITPTWTGTLTSAVFRIQTLNGDAVTDFYVDDVVLEEPGTERTIFRKLLSPSSNPFGAETNPLGIYVIDLSDEKIFIKNSRIVGTLVLLKPKVGSRIGDGGALNWSPAVPGYPALMVRDREVSINPSTAGLNEDANQTNFNPAGTPYPGLGEDLDMNDTYPSQINGLVYCTHKIKFSNQPTLTGAVVAADDIEISDTFNLTHDPVYFRNPPPGFSGPEEIRILLDSAKKTLN